MIFLKSLNENPESLFEEQILLMREARLEEQLIVISYPFCAYWLEGKPLSYLHGLYLLSASDEPVSRFTILDDEQFSGLDQLELADEPRADFTLICSSFSLPSLSPADPSGANGKS